MKRGCRPSLQYQVEETWPSIAWHLSAEHAPSEASEWSKVALGRVRQRRQVEGCSRPLMLLGVRGGVTSQEPPGPLRKFSGLAVAFFKLSQQKSLNACATVLPHQGIF